MSFHSEEIIALYKRHAHDYDTDRSRNLVEQDWLDRFISFLPTRASILDVGCGHGEPIARYLIEKDFDVTGIDASQTLISLCRNRFCDREWLVADMRTLELGKTFHGLIAWDSFFHLSYEDQRRMFPIFKKHAAPGAALLFTSGSSHGESLGSYHGETLYHASLSCKEYSQLLESNGFNIMAHTAEDANCGFHTVWLAQQNK
ncbi:MAG: class I SAM-dependent methyltransferase, partial [Anaerolineae bacterium]|nr:class I SAM-dependent methyltransferase [Gloeobacterales cyanobacterium ES-bin-313]